jgi:hypothetical protein
MILEKFLDLEGNIKTYFGLDLEIIKTSFILRANGV